MSPVQDAHGKRRANFLNELHAQVAALRARLALVEPVLSWAEVVADEASYTEDNQAMCIDPAHITELRERLAALDAAPPSSEPTEPPAATDAGALLTLVESQLSWWQDEGPGSDEYKRGAEVALLGVISLIRKRQDALQPDSGAARQEPATGDTPEKLTALLKETTARVLKEANMTLSEGAAATPDGARQDEFAWVIERGDSPPSAPVYWTGGDDNWSNEHLDAVRFARKQDAERVMYHFRRPNCRVAEHGWMAAPAPAGTPTWPKCIDCGQTYPPNYNRDHRTRQGEWCSTPSGDGSYRVSAPAPTSTPDAGATPNWRVTDRHKDGSVCANKSECKRAHLWTPAPSPPTAAARTGEPQGRPDLCRYPADSCSCCRCSRECIASGAHHQRAAAPPSPGTAEGRDGAHLAERKEVIRWCEENRDWILKMFSDTNGELEREVAALKAERQQEIDRFQAVLVNIHGIATGDPPCDPNTSIGMATSAVQHLKAERDNLQTYIDEYKELVKGEFAARDADLAAERENVERMKGALKDAVELLDTLRHWGHENNCKSEDDQPCNCIIAENDRVSIAARAALAGTAGEPGKGTL